MDIPPKFMRGNQPAERHCDQPIHYFSAPSIAFTARRSVCRRGLASRPALRGLQDQNQPGQPADHRRWRCAIDSASQARRRRRFAALEPVRF